VGQRLFLISHSKSEFKSYEMLSLEKNMLKVRMDGNGSLSRPKLTKRCSGEGGDFKSEGQKYCILIFYYIYRMIQKSPYIGYDICVRHWLDRQFPDHWIARHGPMEWPPRSPDFTPLDFYLRRHFKAMVYQVKIQNVDHLEEGIKRVRREWDRDIRMCSQCYNAHTGRVL